MEVNMEKNEMIAIVTGGTRGIGKSIVRKLCNDGYFTYFTYRSSTQEAQDLENEIGKEFTKGCCCSSENSSDIKQLILEIISTHKKVDLLVNNAGITKDNFFTLMESDDFFDVLDVNVNGTINFTKGIIREMIKKKSGVIINVSSISGLMGSPGQTNYSASKGAIDAFTRSLAKEVGKYNIRVLSVAPGFTETEMFARIPLKIRKQQLETTALKRPARVEEISNVVSFLASKEASYITGTTIRIDGGMS